MNPALFDRKLEEAREFLRTFDLGHALAAYQKLAQQHPQKSEIWFEYGCAACGAGQMDLAERAWSKAIELEPRNTKLLLDIGHNCRGARQVEMAQEWFKKAAALEPRGINPRMALAILHEQEHRFPEAREAVASCLAIDPRDDQARYYEAFLDRRENKLDDAERRLRDLIASNPQHQYVRYASRYELAEVLNRTERYDEAMQQLLEAKATVRSCGPDIGEMLAKYQAEAESDRRASQQQPKDILRKWAKEFPAKSREGMPPLTFLGGHPRSGTTLLEQIVGAHPGVASLDEPAVFLTTIRLMFRDSPLLSPARLNVLRRRYFESIRKEWGGSLEGKLVVDKNPSPTAKLPTWLRIFPELKVLIALRDPRDVVISCFFQNLVLTQANANFLSLERTARHYADLMDVWLAVRQWEGLAWTETKYEDIVADLEKEGRRVTEFLGLTWDPAQAKFYEKSRQRKIYAPTYRDASQPVYRRAVARWHCYEKHLAPILPVLEPYCRALGY
jgi:Flp pilus assembly protein TadD